MKRYKKADFKTLFAQQQAEIAINRIDWAVLREHEKTDLKHKMLEALIAQSRTTGRALTQLPDNHPDIDLPGGKTVPVKKANSFANSHADYTYLGVLMIFEREFAGTVKLNKIFEHVANDSDPEPGELNFSAALRVYPAEASIIYFQTRFAEQMRDGYLYVHLTNYVMNSVSELKIPPGPLSSPLSEDGIKLLVAKEWERIADEMERELIPQLERLRDDPGFRPN